MSHTPGPWTVSFRRSSVEGVNVSFCVDAGAAINIAGGQSQEHLVGYGPILEAECRANARLIAAAPELLGALIEFIGHMDTVKAKNGTALYVPLDSGIVKTARAAIVKATQEA